MYLAIFLSNWSKIYHQPKKQTHTHTLLEINRWNSCLIAFMFAVELTGSDVECELKSELALRDLFYLYNTLNNAVYMHIHTVHTLCDNASLYAYSLHCDAAEWKDGSSSSSSRKSTLLSRTFSQRALTHLPTCTIEIDIIIENKPNLSEHHHHDDDNDDGDGDIAHSFHSFHYKYPNHPHFTFNPLLLLSHVHSTIPLHAQCTLAVCHTWRLCCFETLANPFLHFKKNKKKTSNISIQFFY